MRGVERLLSAISSLEGGEVLKASWMEEEALVDGICFEFPWEG